MGDKKLWGIWLLPGIRYKSIQVSWSLQQQVGNLASKAALITITEVYFAMSIVSKLIRILKAPELLILTRPY